MKIIVCGAGNVGRSIVSYLVLGNNDIIVIDKADAPQIVKERANQINMRRYEKKAQWYFIHKVPLEQYRKIVKLTT